MSSPPPYNIDGAALETRHTPHPFDYQPARAFQADYLDWLYSDRNPVAVLQAPTGGGKTGGFKELIKKQSLSLVVYPTNALMEQQEEILSSDPDINAVVLNGDTLSHHGIDRRDELLSYSQGLKHSYNAILTNPDILQAIIQDQYADYHSKAMRFFEGFDGIVYDEFHVYDAFSASGLLLQLKLIRERRPNARITLASATPKDEYLEFLESRFNIPLERISATYTTDPSGSQFRYPITLNRDEDSIWENRDEIAQNLATHIQNASDIRSPQVVLVFNSARDSNRFHNHLATRWPSVFDHAEKDNGYDTHDGNELADEFYILNTTSKGEVGLDYNIRHLYMDTPWTASSVIQRIGRAGRHASATIHMYGVGHLGWSETMSYETFLDHIWDTFDEPEENETRLQGLLALRAARAVTKREQGSGLNPELYQDFGTVDEYNRWKEFMNAMTTARQASPGPFSPQPSAETDHLIEFVTRALPALDTLRGRTLSHTIQYRRGLTEVTTEYGLLLTLRQNQILGVDNDVIRVTPEARPDSIKMQFAGLPETFEYQTGENGVSEQVWSVLNRFLDASEDNFEDIMDISPDKVQSFVALLGVEHAVTPTRIAVGPYVLDIDEDGDITVTQN